jgi:protein SCO1/2
MLIAVSASTQTVRFVENEEPVSADLRDSLLGLAPPPKLSLQPGSPNPQSNPEFSPKIPDVSVIDQDGRTRHFYSDLVKDRVVVINFIFTRCTTICPPLGATFAELQRNFNSELGKSVFLISVSIDPRVDTPERLRAWGAKFGAKPGWILVTGSPTEIKRLVQSFGVEDTSVEDHSPLFVIGNEKKSLWKKVYGLGSAGVLIKTIRQVRM